MPMSRRNWIIFDGDNTLWETESLYDDARHALCRLIASEAPTVRELEVATFQRKRDHELHAEMGYSQARYPRSFRDTVEHFLGFAHPRADEARRLAESVFNMVARAAPEVDSVLAKLSRSFRIALLTAGERSVQERRIADFDRSRFFDQMRIVPTKSGPVLREFLEFCGADTQSSWMIGDSLKSDIIPATEIGLNSVWLKVANWHEVEVANLDSPKTVRVARSLVEATSIIFESFE
jgi:putative hydrolase of the HAD superfamily